MSDSEDRQLYAKASHLATLAIKDIKYKIQEALGRSLKSEFVIPRLTPAVAIPSYCSHCDYLMSKDD